MIYTLPKDFFGSATFKGCDTFLFRQRKKACSIPWFA